MVNRGLYSVMKVGDIRCQQWFVVSKEDGGGGDSQQRF